MSPQTVLLRTTLTRMIIIYVLMAWLFIQEIVHHNRKKRYIRNQIKSVLQFVDIPITVNINPALRTPTLFQQLCLSRREAHMFSYIGSLYTDNGHLSVTRQTLSHTNLTSLYGRWSSAYCIRIKLFNIQSVWLNHKLKMLAQSNVTDYF